MLVARRFVIAGRVQGVGFRFFVEDIAATEGISGWVRNLRDGRVEVVAEGDLEAVMRFERALRQGPPGARIDAVEVEETAPAGRHTGFTIKPTT